MTAYHYSRNTISFDGKTFSLDDFREWLFRHYPNVVLKHRIKRIYTGGQYRWTYDWDSIFFKADSTGITEEYKQSKL